LEAILTTQQQSSVMDSAPALLQRAELQSRPRRRALIVLSALALLAGVLAVGYRIFGADRQRTDDAQVEGHISSVSSRVAGQVVRVLVRDNQHVQAGELLVELDERELTIRLAAERADLAAAQAELGLAQSQLSLVRNAVFSSLTVARGGVTQASAMGGVSRAVLEQAQADIAEAVAERTLAASELARSLKLFESGALSLAQRDARETRLSQADAVLAQARARFASAEANLGNSAGALQSARGRLVEARAGEQQVESANARVELARAKVQQAEAAVDHAALNHSYTRIRAQISGIVARRTVEVGQLVSIDRPLMAIVATNDLWVVANFKEDQIAHIVPGARAEATIDAFDGWTLHGHVESLAGGTGARFSLFPPDNASGNFTKVVQRVPVLIVLDPHPEVQLVPGLSVIATVFTK
jgi:membrane fusion protein, multidrug efflux system